MLLTALTAAVSVPLLSAGTNTLGVAVGQNLLATAAGELIGELVSRLDAGDRMLLRKAIVASLGKAAKGRTNGDSLAWRAVREGADGIIPDEGSRDFPSIAGAVLGGDDDAVATALRPLLGRAPGYEAAREEDREQLEADLAGRFRAALVTTLGTARNEEAFRQFLVATLGTLQTALRRSGSDVQASLDQIERCLNELSDRAAESRAETIARLDGDLPPNLVFLGVAPFDAHAARLGRGPGLRRIAPRTELESALRDFYGSSDSVFVLVGESGQGKTTALDREARALLAHRPRCVVTAGKLFSTGSLRRAVGEALTPESLPTRSTEQIYRAALNVAREDGTPLIVISDNLLASLTGRKFAERLGELAQEAANDGIKLVLASTRPVWRHVASHVRDLPGLYLDRRAVAREGLALAAGESPFSFLLGSLEDTELRDILRLRLGEERGEAFYAVMSDPAYAALRNAQLLASYLRLTETRSPRDLQPATIDQLLDDVATQASTGALSTAGLLPARGPELLSSLAEVAWEERREGLDLVKLARTFSAALGGNGDALVQGLQAEGLLTGIGTERLVDAERVTFAQPSVGDRLFARHLGRSGSFPNVDDARLVPELDDGVVTALVRGASRERREDGLAWCADLVRRNAAWGPAVCEGVGQIEDDDPAAPAFLVANANRRGRGLLHAVAGPLGRRASHSDSTRRWIRSLYLSEHGAESLLGEQAMGRALAVNPEWTIGVVRERLERDVAHNARLGHDRERRADRIGGALEPLQWATHRRAAEEARKLLRWLEAEHPLPARGPDQHIGERYDEPLQKAWGVALRHGDEPAFRHLIERLSSEDPYERDSAALALFPVVFEEPGYPGLREAILDALGKEKEAVVSVQHLAFPYAVNGDVEFVDALAASDAVTDWRGSLAITELGILARTGVARIASILPKDHSAFGDWRGLIAESLALAWLRVGLAGERASAEERLREIATDDLRGLPKPMRSFAARGASVATLALILLDLPGVRADVEDVPTVWHDQAREMNEGFGYADFEALLTRYGAKVARHPLARDFVVRSARVFKEAVRNPVDIRVRAYVERQFRIQQITATELSLVVPYCKSALDVAATLKRGYAGVRICVRMMQEGIESVRALEIARRIVVEATDPDIEHDVSELEEAATRLGSQDGLVADPGIAVEGRRLARHAAVVEEGSSASAIESLELALARHQPATFLFEWPAQARGYKAQLLARASREVLSQRELAPEESDNIARLLTRFTEGASDSQIEGARAVLIALKAEAWRKGSEWTADRGRALSDNDTNWTRSINGASALLSLDPAQQGDGLAVAILEIVARSGAAVFDAYSRIDTDGAHTVYRDAGTVWIPPAVRVAGVIAAERGVLSDPIGAWLARRRSFAEESARSRLLPFEGSRPAPHVEAQENLRRWIHRREELAADYDDLPNAHNELTYGRLLALDLEGALAAAGAGLALPQIEPSVQAELLYFHACVIALTGSGDAREPLLRALTLDPTLRQDASSNPDLSSLFAETWFLNAINGEVAATGAVPLATPGDETATPHPPLPHIQLGASPPPPASRRRGRGRRGSR